jgi:hypothetical protein
MAKPTRSAIERELLDRHGTTYARELGADVAKGTPSALFKLAVGAILLSAPIGAKQGTRAANALFDQGWTTARKLADTTWEERVRVLNENGYARYDERTASMLADASELLLDRYSGDLRKLRDQAGRRQGAGPRARPARVHPAGGRPGPFLARQGPRRDPGDGRHRVTPRRAAVRRPSG